MTDELRNKSAKVFAVSCLQEVLELFHAFLHGLVDVPNPFLIYNIRTYPPTPMKPD
jgi:hypothetical protein